MIQNNGIIQLPDQTINEYDITAEGKIYLFTGSKSTGGFCVTRRGLLESSKLGHILTDTPVLKEHILKSGTFIKYKGRSYTWMDISKDGKIKLTDAMLSFLNREVGMKLLSNRSSDIAFTMGTNGPLLKEAEKYEKEIPLF